MAGEHPDASHTLTHSLTRRTRIACRALQSPPRAPDLVTQEKQNPNRSTPSQWRAVLPCQSENSTRLMTVCADCLLIRSRIKPLPRGKMRRGALIGALMRRTPCAMMGWSGGHFPCQSLPATLPVPWSPPWCGCVPWWLLLSLIISQASSDASRLLGLYSIVL